VCEVEQVQQFEKLDLATVPRIGREIHNGINEFFAIARNQHVRGNLPMH
jgi:NAD-dependent DNA ligase